jgi:hypothetical protein
MDPGSFEIRHRRQSFLLPIANATELHGLVTRMLQRFSDARRASTTASIENNLCVFG